MKWKNFHKELKKTISVLDMWKFFSRAHNFSSRCDNKIILGDHKYERDLYILRIYNILFTFLEVIFWGNSSRERYFSKEFLALSFCFNWKLIIFAYNISWLWFSLPLLFLVPPHLDPPPFCLSLENKWTSKRHW